MFFEDIAKAKASTASVVEGKCIYDSPNSSMK